MRIPLRTKALGALAAAAALVMLASVPAGAGTITGASLSIAGDTFSLPGGGTGPCAAGSDTIAAAVTTSSISVTAVSLSGSFEAGGAGSGDWWTISTSLQSQNSGSVSGSTINSLDLTLNFSIEDRNNSTCADLAAPACTGRVGLALSGSWNSAPTPDTASLSGSSTGSAYGDLTDFFTTACGSAVGDYIDAELIVNSLNAQVNP